MGDTSSTSCRAGQVASLDSIAPRFAVEAHLGELFTDEAADESSLDKNDSQTIESQALVTESEREQFAQTNQERQDWLARDGAPDRTIIRAGYRRRSDFEASTTDPDAALLVRAYHQTPVYAKAMAKRKVWVEPVFGEAKDWHSLGRFRLRRLWKVTIEVLLIATGQDLERLLRKRGWGRRPWPNGAPEAHSARRCMAQPLRWLPSPV